MTSVQRMCVFSAIVFMFAFSHTAFAATMQANRPWATLSGLVGYWSFNGPDVSDKIYDRSGQGNNAYFIGGATSSAKTGGIMGQAVQFDGVDDYVQLTTDIVDVNTVTVCAWIYPNSVVGNFQNILSNYRFTFGVYSSGELWLDSNTSAGGVGITGSVLSVKKWQHICAVRQSGANGPASLYLNGNPDGSGNSDTPVVGVLPLSISESSATYPYAGSLDEVRIYNRALTASEVHALYRGGVSVVAKTIPTAVKDGLVGWWTFDGKDVNTTAPTSDNSNSITPGTGGVLAGGTLSWGSTGNILADDNSYASVTLSGTAQSNYLRASNFGFSIPTDATIVGIEGDITRKRSGGTTGDARDYSVRLVDDTGALVGNDKAWTGSNWPTTEAWACFDLGCYGSNADMWGTSLTPTQVNDSDFGVALQVTGDAGGADRSARVDVFDIVIYYQTPGGALDRSGSGNHGTINSVRATAGKIGQAMEFNGATSYITLANDPIDVNTVTVCAWIYPNRVTGQFEEILTNNRFTFGIYAGGSGELWLDSNTSAGSLILGNPLTARKWQHVCAVRNSGANGPATLYLNGAFDASGNSDTPISSGIPLEISDQYDGWAFDGKIDDVRIYNRALTAPEIKQIYNEGGGVTVGKTQTNVIPSGLVGYWSFNGPDFTARVYDRSGQGHHGDVVGIATSSIKTAGRIGQAIVFDGSGGRINTGTQLIQSPGAVTVSAWIYPTSWDDYHSIVNGETTYFSVLFYDHCLSWTNDNGGTLAASASGSILLNKWQHVVAVRGADNKITFYINGVQSDTANQDAGTPSLATWETHIGARYDGIQPFSGKIDEVRIYNRALTASEVKQLFLSGK